MEHWTYTEDRVDGSPRPECIPFDAPTDYENVSPADADPYDAFFFIAHKRANSTTMNLSTGTVIAEIAGATYTQTMAGLTMNSGTTYFNIFTTNGGITAGTLDMGIISKASRAFEDVDRGIYVGQETSDSSDIVVDLDTPYDEFAATVTNWGSKEEVTSRQELFARFGHDLFSTTSYYVPDSSAIISASMRPDGDNYIFTFNFSLVDDDTHTNAATYYTNTLNEGIASNAFQFVITELTWVATVNEDWEILSTESTERYDMDVSLLGGLTIQCVNTGNATFWYYDDDEGCDNESAIEQWNDAVTSMDIVDQVDLLD